MKSTACLAFAVATIAAAGVSQADSYRPPHDAYGHPDMEGVWDVESATVLVRPKQFKALVATPDEAAVYEARQAARYARNTADLTSKDFAPPPVGELSNHDPEQWYGPPLGLATINGQRRTSWIVEPEDGQLPLSAAARRRGMETEGAADGLNNPEDRFYDERCLLGSGGGAGAPLLGGGVNTVFQFVQTKDQVAILAEANHDTRIVRLSDRKHLPAQVRPWMGDSVGWWEGDTLVVETANFRAADSWRFDGAMYIIGEKARVTERITRVGPGQLLVRFEVIDPENYTRPWRGEAVLHRIKGPVFEYACHEGNYALENILAGARSEERSPVAKAVSP